MLALAQLRGGMCITQGFFIDSKMLNGILMNLCANAPNLLRKIGKYLEPCQKSKTGFCYQNIKRLQLECSTGL